ncbi:NH(3)-dependent NAD(+) synthetase [Gemmatirosa kalamazoonensis]|uniref:Glutamine-dependent NAD(+) synthetase n=2 Tax=Gemmatirosa kalamazoonensis TaxID=861299 RepID=W0RNR9_9BACT|nr:NAD+ synthase [Gemmatirosa kalamazoonensis]AHG91990.1 NH(3)-dependent NAD(+) synthetase [Gemmatirosa kalamazoonensis]
MLRPLTIALVQFKPSKGDYDANLARIAELLAECATLEPRPDVVHLPETALTGYFVEGGVRDLAVTSGTVAADLDTAYRAAAARRGHAADPLDVVVGFYEVWRNTLHNAAMYVTVGDGPAPRSTLHAPRSASPNDDASVERGARSVEGGPVIHHVHRKHFLPTYGLFDEERFVERGFDLRAFDAPWGRAAILVCEDAWHSLTGTIVALDGAQLVFVCSAAPARGIWPRDDGLPGPASVSRWERLVRDIAEEHGVYVSYVNLVGSEGGKGFFGASSVIGPRGDVRCRLPVWDEAILSITIDLEDLTRARADAPLLNDLRVTLPHLLANLDRAERGEPARLEYDPASTEHAHGLVSADERGDGAAGAGTPEVGSPGAAVSPSPSDPAQGLGTGGPPPHPQQATSGPAAHNGKLACGIPVTHVRLVDNGTPPPLDVDGPMTERWLVTFLQDEFARRGFNKAVVGLSGGVDSAVTAFLCARALGPENVIGVRMPYRTSSPESLEHAQLVGDALGMELRTIEITNAVDGYLAFEPDADPARRGNVMARMRMIILFDLSSRYRALPVGTGNKTERLFGYFTWHADDSPPINPLGDLYKSQVWALARQLGVPDIVISKPASADLIKGQTDEGDFGISYARADVLLNWLLNGHSPEDLVARGFDPAEVELVRRRLSGTHWKRRLPAVAMVSPTAIGEAYLRPVDY